MEMLSEAIEDEQLLRAQFQKYLFLLIDSELAHLHLPAIRVLEDSVLHKNYFSPNQPLTEVCDQHLLYLLTPVLVARSLQTVMLDRLSHISQALSYYEAYFNVMLHYNCQDQPTVPPQLLKYKKALEDGQLDPSKLRQLLIANQRAKMQVQKQLQVQFLKEGIRRNSREVLLKYLLLELYESVRGTKLIKEQIQILKFQKLKQTNEETAAKYEEELKKPIPKLKYWKLQKPQEPLPGLTTHPLCDPCKEDIIQTSIQTTRIDKLDQVFSMNPNQPTMTNDEVDQLEYQNFMKREARNKKLKEQNKQDSDSDKQEVDDRKKQEARRWDDWKDAHEKGIGNRGNR